jgi:hypothetical protein
MAAAATDLGGIHESSTCVDIGALMIGIACSGIRPIEIAGA